jgi:SAM-dependent methyltransferase
MMKAALRERSRIVFDEIKQVSTGKTLLDVGCGDGIVAQMLNPRFSEILLTDVANYVDRDVQLPFLPYMEGGRLPVEKSLDTVLLLTVLHHASDPLTLLRESWRATAKRLVIIETVFGVHEQPPTGHYELADFDESDQIAFAVFVDWLYNRVLHDDVPTPYNFTTPQRWLDTFAELGMRVAELKNLGQDIQIVPELHYLFVLER